MTTRRHREVVLWDQIWAPSERPAQDQPTSLQGTLDPGLAFHFSLEPATDQSNPFTARPVGMVGLGRSSAEKLYLPGPSISNLERQRHVWTLTRVVRVDLRPL